MTAPRLFAIAEIVQPAEGQPVRAVVTETPESVVIAWTVLPGQHLAPHVHPGGQDTWTVISGQGDYIPGLDQPRLPIHAGHIVVARAGDVHGVVNTGDQALVIISVVAPANAGYALVD